MYSVNVPVPPAVTRLAADLHPTLVGFDVVRDRHSLVLKRLGSPVSLHATEKRARRALEGAPACEARVAHVGVFRDPPRRPAPVVYLAVESPGLDLLHRRLLSVTDPVAGMEDDDYVPHVTLARGGDHAAADRLTERAIEPVTWTVTELVLYDARYDERAGRIPLPA